MNNPIILQIITSVVNTYVLPIVWLSSSVHTTVIHVEITISNTVAFQIPARHSLTIPHSRETPWINEKADPIARDTWMKETKPILDKLMLEPGTTVLCEDEMVLTAKTTTQRIWLPAGEYPPVLEVNGTRKNKSFYGFLNLKTGQEHTFITNWQNMYITVEILNKLRKVYPTEKLVIIWDNCSWHRGSKVTKWIKTDGNTQILYFPPYTPDLNPQERVWKAGRKAITHNQYIQKIEETAIKFKDYIESQIFSYELLGHRAVLAQH